MRLLKINPSFAESLALIWKIEREYGSDIAFQEISFAVSIILWITNARQNNDKKARKKHIINGLYLIKTLEL